MGATEWSQKHYDIPVCECVSVCMCMHNACMSEDANVCAYTYRYKLYSYVVHSSVCVLCDCVCMGACMSV